MAMVQERCIDAVNSIAGGYGRAWTCAAAPPGASIDAAVATAAHDVLIQVIPLVAPLTDATMREGSWRGVQTQYETELAAISAGGAKSARRDGGCRRRRGDARRP